VEKQHKSTAKRRSFFGRPACGSKEYDDFINRELTFLMTLCSGKPTPGWVPVKSVASTMWEHPQHDELWHAWLDEQGIAEYDPDYPMRDPEIGDHAVLQEHSL